MLVRSCVCIEGAVVRPRITEHELHPLLNSSTITKLTISIVLELVHAGQILCVYRRRLTARQSGLRSCEQLREVRSLIWRIS